MLIRSDAVPTNEIRLNVEILALVPGFVTGQTSLPYRLYRLPVPGERMDRSERRNVLLLAAIGTEPADLFATLNSHPEIAAPRPIRLTALLHTASRGAVREVRRSDAGAPVPLAETMAYARRASTAALASVFDEVHHRLGARVVILSDPDRLTYPFSDISGVDVVLLRPGTRTLGFDGLLSSYEQHIGALVKHDIDGLISRTQAWGITDERIFSIDEDEVYSESGLKDLLTFLGTDACHAPFMLTQRSAGRATAAD